MTSPSPRASRPGLWFETFEQAGESTKVVAKWITDENFSTAIPNAPKITSGKVVAHSNGVAVA